MLAKKWMIGGRGAIFPSASPSHARVDLLMRGRHLIAPTENRRDLILPSEALLPEVSPEASSFRGCCVVRGQ